MLHPKPLSIFENKSMKKIVIIIFDGFTDIDLFLMWDLLGRNKKDWTVKILGTNKQHLSANGLQVATHGDISEANEADVVLFSSGKGTRRVIKDPDFLSAFNLNPSKQIIASVCSGALILASLGLLNRLTATTHPRAKEELKKMGVEVLDLPLVCHDNLATAGGCLSAQYLVGWVVDKICGSAKRKEILSEIMPVGQRDIYEDLIEKSIEMGLSQNFIADKKS